MVQSLPQLYLFTFNTFRQLCTYCESGIYVDCRLYDHSFYDQTSIRRDRANFHLLCFIRSFWDFEKCSLRSLDDYNQHSFDKKLHTIRWHDAGLKARQACWASIKSLWVLTAFWLLQPMLSLFISWRWDSWKSTSRSDCAWDGGKLVKGLSGIALSLSGQS